MFQQSKHQTQSPGDIAYWTLGFLFLVGMHYLQSHPPGDGLQVSFNTFSWIPISVAIGVGLFTIVTTSILRVSSLTRGLCVAFCIILVPVFYRDSAELIDLGRFYMIAAGLLLFIVLQQMELSESRAIQLFLFVLLGVWIEAILGWTQFAILGPDNFMGFDPENHRPYGVFRQPNVMASLLATGVVLSIYLLVRFQQSSAHHLCYSIVCLFTPLLMIPLLVVLSSRVGWLGVLLGSLLALPYLFTQLGKRLTIAWIAIFSLGFVVGVLLVDSSGVWSQVSAKLQSDPNRSFIYPQVIRMIFDQPLLGVGYGNFEASYNLYAADLYASGITENAGYPNLHHPHNELLFWGAEGGAVALFGLLFAAYLVFKSILKAPPGQRLILVALFFPIVLHTQTEYPFYHSVVHWVIFVLLIHLVDVSANQKKEIKLGSTILFGAAGVFIPVTTVLFMLTTLHAGAILTRFEQVPGTRVSTLLNIVNPIVWQERIRWELSSTAMFAGLAQGDTTAAYAFIEIIEKSLQDKPRHEAYQNLIFSYEFVNDRENAEAAMLEAKYRYPNIDFVDTSDGELVILKYEDVSEI